MLEILTDVVRNLVVLIIIATVLELVLPQNHFRPYINMVVGLVMMLMLLTPVRMLLRLPGDMEPAVLRAAGLSETELDGRLEMMSQLTWEMSLSRYRELLSGRIAEVLAGEGYTMTGLTLELIEDPTHLEFGRPLKTEVLARAGGADTTEITMVEPVRIGGRGAALPAGQEVAANRRLSAEVAEQLGLPAESVVVVVAD